MLDKDKRVVSQGSIFNSYPLQQPFDENITIRVSLTGLVQDSVPAARQFADADWFAA